MLQVVGLGTQDSLDDAFAFVDNYGTTSFPMLWDPTFDSWAALGVTGQPAAMLMTSDGRIVEAWSGAIPETQVLDLVDQLTTAGV